MASTTLKILGKVIYRVRGWTFEPLPAYWQPKQVLIAFPHAAWLDTAMAFSGFAMTDQKGHILVKKESFRLPVLGALLKALGGVPVDRFARTGMVEQMVAQFEARDTFQLALVPQGTRKNVERLKTGFWHIAKGAGVQIVCWYIDSDARTTRWVGKLDPSDDMQADLAKLRQMYAAHGHDITAWPLPADLDAKLAKATATTRQGAVEPDTGLHVRQSSPHAAVAAL